MDKKPTLSEVIKILSKRDIEALKSIYDLRCLTFEQIYQLHYSKSLKTNKLVSNSYCKRKINEFLNLDLIEKSSYGNLPPVFFLTSLGVEIVIFYFNFSTNVYDIKKKVVKRGYFKASELKFSNKLINHQTYLNQFFIDFKKIDFNTIWKYIDGKHMDKYVNIRPDSLLTIYDIDFFIEMDMNSENKKKLIEKWNNYRTFINSREFFYKERKIIVLFVIENTNKIQDRINLVRHTAYEELLGMFDNDFDIYIGTKDNLFDTIKHKLIPNSKNKYTKYIKIKDILEEKFDFKVLEGDKVKQLFNETEYLLYVRKLNKDGNILIENNRPQEYLIDEYFHSPLYTLSKIAYFDYNNTIFKSKFNREIPLIIICENEKQIYNDLRLVDMLGINNVYFSTLERLKNKSFPNAIFTFDRLGNMYYFEDYALQRRIFEKNMNN